MKKRLGCHSSNANKSGSVGSLETLGAYWTWRRRREEEEASANRQEEEVLLLTFWPTTCQYTVQQIFVLEVGNTMQPKLEGHCHWLGLY